MLDFHGSHIFMGRSNKFKSSIILRLNTKNLKMLEQRKLELREYRQILQNLLNLFQNAQFTQLNHFYDEIYPISLQAKVKSNLPIKHQFFEWCEIEKFQKLAHWNQQQIVAQLNLWHQQAPSLYSAYLLGQFWSNVASAERGSDYAHYVSQAAWDRAEIAKDMSFYWFMKAIEIDEKCPWVYLSLLLLTGFLRLPYWFWNDAVDLAVQEHYSPESLAFLQHFGQSNPQRMNVPSQLPEPNQEEKDYPVLYWLNCALSCDAEFIPALRNYVYYLYPRWYGHEHDSIDAFLQSPVCQNLPQEKFNELLITKYYDWLECEYPAVSDQARVLQYEKLFEEIIQFDLNNFRHTEVLLQYTRFLEWNIRDDEKQLYARSQHFAQRLVEVVDFLLKEHEYNLFWAVDAHERLVSDICWLFVKFPELIQDHSHLRYRLLTLLQPFEDSAFIMTILAAASEAGIWGFRKGEYVLEPEKVIAHDDSNSTYNAEYALRLFYVDRQYVTVHKILCDLAVKGHAQSAYELGLLLKGEGFGGHGDMARYHDEDLSRQWLEHAVALEHPEAVAEQALQQYNALMEQDNKPQTQVQAILQQLERAAQLKQSQVLSSYIHLMNNEGTPEQQQILLQEIIPEIMLNRDYDQHAWLAYLYAFSCEDGMGIEKNRYLALFWIDQALQLAPDEEEYKALFEKWSKPSGMFFAKSRFEEKLKQGKENIPEWMMQVVVKFMQLKGTETTYFE